MKTIEEIEKHLKENGYRQSAINTICLFLKDAGMYKYGCYLGAKLGERTFMDFMNWYSTKEDTSHLPNIEEEFNKIVEEEIEKHWGKITVNPFDCESCSCTSKVVVFNSLSDNTAEIEDMVTSEIVCENLESVVNYLEDLDNLPIHLQRVNETLKLLIDSVEHHKKNKI